MSLDLTIRPRARQDITEHTAYLDDHTANAGDRFIAELEHIFDRLTTFPAFGQPWQTPTGELTDIRRAVLPRLPYSVFYRTSATTIDVIRVLHHAQDIPSLIEDV